MPTKREILELLKRDELLQVVDNFGLEPADRRAKAGLVDAVATSRKAALGNILDSLKRDRLKELCRSFELDDSGREKQVIIERLRGVAYQEAEPSFEKEKPRMQETKKDPSTDSLVANFKLEATVSTRPKKKEKPRFLLSTAAR